MSKKTADDITIGMAISELSFLSTEWEYYQSQQEADVKIAEFFNDLRNCVTDRLRKIIPIIKDRLPELDCTPILRLIVLIDHFETESTDIFAATIEALVVLEQVPIATTKNKTFPPEVIEAEIEKFYRPVDCKLRPCYQRDFWFRSLSSKEKGPAAIRDIWNELDEETRKKICPRDPKKLIGDLGRGVVANALKPNKK